MKKITKKVVKKAKTKAERRVEILKDVLKQLKLERYKATSGTYVDLSNSLTNLLEIDDETGDYTEDSRQIDAKECLLKDKGQCTVCAKGSIFLSLVRKENKVKLIELQDDDIREVRSNALFGEANMDLIEAVFEGWYYKRVGYCQTYSAYSEDAVFCENIYNFYTKYSTSTNRLVAIVKNCIENGGIFKP